MRKIYPWETYDQMAAAGEYGMLLNNAGELTITAKDESMITFFQKALVGKRRVLDVGCGPGFPLVVLAEHTKMIYGVDASQAMLALARGNINALRIQNAVLIRALAETLPFADGTFDGFAISGTLGSVPEPPVILTELSRVAAKEAVVASIEQDFRTRLRSGSPRQQCWLRREPGSLFLQVVWYLTAPYRIRTERYVLDISSDFVQCVLADHGLYQTRLIPTNLLPEDIPAADILDAFYEEEVQFDPVSLREAFEYAGFAILHQYISTVYRKPHIFSIFRHI